MVIKAVVITGVSGVGKDETFHAIHTATYNRAVKVSNTKFSDPIKQAFALWLGVPREALDNKEFRAQPIEFLDGLTPLDLLVRSFHVMPQISPRLGLYSTQRHVESLLTESTIPVFTDGRNEAEAQWLTSYFTPSELVVVPVSSTVRGQALSSDYLQSVNEARLVSYADRVVHIKNDDSDRDAIRSGAKRVVSIIEENANV